MLDYEFMRNAFMAGGLVAILAGAAGYFLVLRGQAFAGHALSHVGFAGATGAALIGTPPIFGMLAFMILGAAAMGALGKRLRGSDVAIGAVLALSLGLGMLFLHFFTAYASQVTALLFGNVLGVDRSTLRILGVSTVLCLVLLAFISRPLLFASLQPELAEAKGVSLRTVGILYLIIVAVATAASIQIVGVLLVFTLLVCPAAAAQRLTSGAGNGIILSILLALLEAWLGIALAYLTDWPVSFWISALSVGIYLAASSVRSIALQTVTRHPIGG
ncbi:MAG: metal ABC transporter permease [Castellaniella sp.]|uniref:metal ABC transporter permease n=1 Tax=Castellaniella sp. TaxID=1955812 RepID=UPI0011F58394|nr:metal ABC transporter permease [Castellaniella sp.]TAN31165.1 MAG: metal ABC transporter permease [Castellaniella sp.]